MPPFSSSFLLGGMCYIKHFFCSLNNTENYYIKSIYGGRHRPESQRRRERKSQGQKHSHMKIVKVEVKVKVKVKVGPLSMWARGLEALSSFR